MSLSSSSCGLYFSAQSFNGPSNHPGVTFKFINRISLSISRQNIFIKTLILVKIASHIGCNGRQDSNVIIIFLNSRDSLLPKTDSTISFNHKNCAAILYFLCGIHRTEKEMDGTCGTRSSPINISHRNSRNFPESFGKWKTPAVSTFSPIYPGIP